MRCPIFPDSHARGQNVDCQGVLLRPGECRLEQIEVVQVHVPVAVGIEPALAEVLGLGDLAFMA